MKFSYATTTSVADWGESVLDNLAVQNGGVQLASHRATRQHVVTEGVRDLSVGPDGTLYTIRTDGGVYRYDAATETAVPLLKRTDRAVEEPCAVCASASRVFVCDATDGSITALSPQLKRVVGTLRPELTGPTALSYADGTIYALTERGVVAVDRAGRATSVFEAALANPVAIEARDDGVVVLDRGEDGASVHVFPGPDHAGSAPEQAGEFDVGGESFTPTCLTVVDGRPAVGGRFDDRDGYGVFMHDSAAGRFEQRTTLAVPPHGLAAQAGDTDEQLLYAVTGDERTCRCVENVQEYANHPTQDRHVGTAILRYDAGVKAIDWHRLTLGIVRSSASTQVRVRYTATDEPALLALDADRFESMSAVAESMLHNAGITSLWGLATADPNAVASETAKLDPDDVRSWQRRAAAELATQATEEWTTSDVIDPRDVLLDEATGRRLYVAIELLGTPKASPLVDSVRAFCPRTSYLRHMPEVYQDDEQSAAFLEQFLSVMESSFVDIEAEIDAVGEYFDPQGVGSDSLAWLEGWLAADLGRDWPESARRELLTRAPELYKQRGTKAGLLELVRLYLRHTSAAPPDGAGETSATPASTHGEAERDEVPQRLFFVERADLDGVDSATVERQYGEFLAGDRSFAVFCGPFDSTEQRRAVEAIVESERPAHVEGTVVPIEPECTLGESSFLGLNTTLSAREFAMGDAKLGEDTVLTPRNPAASSGDS